jgi:hypothetical protein
MVRSTAKATTLPNNVQNVMRLSRRLRDAAKRATSASLARDLKLASVLLSNYATLLTNTIARMARA